MRKPEHREANAEVTIYPEDICQSLGAWSLVLIGLVYWEHEPNSGSYVGWEVGLETPSSSSEK